MKLMRNPVPCTATAHIAIGSLLTGKPLEASSAAIRVLAKGAVRSKGYPGNTQTGVIVWIGNILSGSGSVGTAKHISQGELAHWVDQRIKYMPTLATMLTKI